MREKKVFAHPDHKDWIYELYNRGDDLSCRWFWKWKENGARKTRYGNINRGKTYRERLALAMELLPKLYEEHRKCLPETEALVYARKYLDRHQKTWEENTYNEYTGIVNKFFKYLNGRKPSAKLARQYMAGLQKRLAGTTYNKVLHVLIPALKEGGYSYVFADVDRMKVRTQPYYYFQRRQQKELVAYMEENLPELLLFCQFMYYCFLRPKEIRLTKVGDILWDDMNIRIPGKTAKNDKYDIAIIPDAFVKSIEENFLRNSPKEYLFQACHKKYTYKPIGAKTMSSRHRRMLKKLGYGEGFTLYSWRHTAAVEALKSGVGIKSLSVLMRHSSLEQTANYVQQLGWRDNKEYRKLMRVMGTTD